ncbi:MAG: UDP-glucuronic acid decarboxylase family protein [Candidatus Dependentiae bacterium]
MNNYKQWLFFVISVISFPCIYTQEQQKNVLVTGGAGFLGSHLCKRLLDLDYNVIAVDNLYTGRLDNIESLFEDKRFSFKHHDITYPLDIQVDYIFNLACPASPPHYQKDPIFTTKTCVLGAINMLELAKKYNALIMQASTSEVYGDPEVHPQVETYRGLVNPIGIRSCYDEGKRCAESLFFDYHRQYNVPIKVVRIFNTYGPNMDPRDGRVVSNFIMQALKGEPLTIYGSGLQTRSFCYVDDLIDGFISMMFDTASDFTGPINLGNPDEYNLVQLAEMILHSIQSDSQIVYLRLPKDDPCRRKPDILLARKELNWSPQVHLINGLQKTIEYFKKFVD